jgi:hypothetical protein
MIKKLGLILFASAAWAGVSTGTATFQVYSGHGGNEQKQGKPSDGPPAEKSLSSAQINSLIAMFCKSGPLSGLWGGFLHTELSTSARVTGAYNAEWDLANIKNEPVHKTRLENFNTFLADYEQQQPHGKLSVAKLNESDSYFPKLRMGVDPNNSNQLVFYANGIPVLVCKVSKNSIGNTDCEAKDILLIENGYARRNLCS